MINEKYHFNIFSCKIVLVEDLADLAALPKSGNNEKPFCVFVLSGYKIEQNSGLMLVFCDLETISSTT